MLNKRARAVETLAKRLRNYLLWDMQQHNEEWIQAGRFKISRRNTERVKLTGPVDALPAKYKKIVTTADKMGLKRALKAGETVIGAELESGEYVEFRIR